MDVPQAIVAIPHEVLDSLCSRFLINIPGEERNNMIRVFFQIELAHWFYIDFYRSEKPTLPGCGVREFSRAVFRHCPFLKEENAKVDEHFAVWKEYKMSVPTYGAIMLNQTLQHIVLVQSYFSKTSWGFPKGKVNEGEAAKLCAIREVSEETGYDISGLIDEDEFIEATFNDQLSRLYVVPNVPMDFEFKPKTRGEIKGVKWFHIDDLPTHKKDNAPKLNLGLNPNNFFMAIPYMKKLKKKIDKLKGHKDPPRIESPFEALTKLAQQPIVQAAYKYGSDTPSKEKLSGPPTLNGITADHKQLLNDHRHKMKQQRAFVSQNQSQTDVFMRLRDSQHEFRDGSNERRYQQHNRASPTAVQTHAKGKMQVNGAGSPQKQYQILTRNSAKGYLGDLSTDSVKYVTNGDRPHHRERLSVPAFSNFRLDTTSIMRAFDSGLYSRTTLR